MKPVDLKTEFDRKQAETKGYCSALKWMAERLEQEERENLHAAKESSDIPITTNTAIKP